MTTSNSTKPPISRLAFVCAGLLLIGSPLSAEDWPFERGGEQSTGVANSALPGEPELLWKYTAEASAFEAAPVVVDGVAYLGDADGAFHAVRVSDGISVWTKRFEETGFLTPAAIRGDRVFVCDYDGLLHCLSKQDGSEHWSFATNSEVFTGPIVTSDLLLITTESGSLHALDSVTGEERWAYTIEAPLRCGPTVVSGHVMLAGCDGKLHTVSASTGKEAGSAPIGGPTGNTAAARDGVAYFGTEQGEFFAIDANDPNTPMVKWTYRDPRRGQSIRTSAAVTNNVIVYANQAKTVYCLSPEQGEPLWNAPQRARVEASPLIAGDRAVIVTSRGRLMLLDLADGETTWDYDAGGSFLASPIVVQGRLLVANTDGVLYCFGDDSTE